MGAWTVDDSLALYNVAAWGEGFFTINEAGRVEVRRRYAQALDEGTYLSRGN